MSPALDPPTLVRTGGSPAPALPDGYEELASVPPPALRAGAPPTISIVQADAGYRLWSADGGEFLVSSDGLCVECRTAGVPDEQWEPMLIGQVLPLVAVLRGREVLHASGITLDDGAVALVGPSGVGKSTLSSELLARGGSLISDNVLALQEANGGAIAYPGPAHVRLGTGRVTGPEARLPHELLLSHLDIVGRA